MSHALAWIADVAAARSAQGLTRRLCARGPAAPGRFDRDGRMLINLGSNDYLGLAADPRLAAAATAAAARYGWGAGASPLVSGWTVAHQELVDALAAFERTESAMLFPSGFAANLGTIAALVNKSDAVYLDRLSHACLIDGARLSGATLRVFRHNDVDRLDAALTRDRGRFRRVLIATDGVFSMDGDLAPLAALADLAERWDAILLVDEAHGTGVFGPDGRGAASACAVAERVHVRVGTLSKALGSIGGFVAGSKELIGFLINHARSQVYSTSIPPAAAAAARVALEIARDESWRRARVHELSARVRAAARARGGDVGASVGPIVPLIVGAAAAATTLAARCVAAGLFVPAIRPPTVPDGTARLRISLSAAHEDSVVDRLMEVFDSA